jgi:hypothetical protein
MLWRQTGAGNTLGDEKLTQNCVFPPELDDKQLMAYLDGEADEATRSHLKGCAHCREKAETLDRFQKRLISKLYRLTCPPSIQLGEYQLRMLPASQMLVIGQHLRECPYCAREVSELEGFLSDEVPVEGLLGRAKLLIARLVGAGDLTFTPAPALRGEAKGPITFAAEGMIIVLDIQPDMEGRVDILGQVAADNQDDWTGALVELRKDSQFKISSRVDDLGAFQCEGVIPGQHELRITSKNGSIVMISNFEVPI